MPALPDSSAYDAADAYSAGSQYRAGLTSSPYGDSYGTGTYSDYSTTRGEYSTEIPISRYGDSSGGGYGYTAGETVRSYGETAFDYVVGVLDGDVDMAYGSQFCYT